MGDGRYERLYRVLATQVYPSEDHIRRSIAFDGKQLTVTEHSDVIDTAYQSLPKKWQGNWGAALSHITLWRHIGTHYPVWHTILEDDAYPRDGTRWRQDMAHILQAVPDDIDLIYWGWHGDEATHTAVGQNRGLPLQEIPHVSSVKIAPIRYAIGLWAYALRVSSVSRLLKHMLPLKQAIDYSVAHLVSTGVLKAWATVPSLIQHPGVTVQSPFGVRDVCKVAYSSYTQH